MKRMVLMIVLLNGMSAIDAVGVTTPFPQQKEWNVYKIPEGGIGSLTYAPGEYIPPRETRGYAGGRLIEPYVVQEKGKSYVYTGEVTLAQPKAGQDHNEMMEVLIRRNFLLKKAGLDSDALRAEEKEDLAKILAVYPIIKI